MTSESIQRLTKADRHARIVAELRAAPQLRVAQLAIELGVSTETIRRDLDELGERGLISRTYGGAVRALATEPGLRERHAMMVEERSRIGALAARRLRPGEVVMMGAGATTVHVARRIAAECKGLTIITHSFGVATVLAANPTLTVLLTPGVYDGEEGCVLGEETTDFLARWRADRAILGSSALCEEGASDVNLRAAAVYRAMRARAGETVIVADHSKFDRRAVALWSGWNDIDTLVTDRAPGGPLRDAIEEARVELIVAGTR